ncbi:unnamed protein product [Ectocarpus fasciculatus]
MYSVDGGRSVVICCSRCGDIAFLVSREACRRLVLALSHTCMHVAKIHCFVAAPIVVLLHSWQERAAFVVLLAAFPARTKDFSFPSFHLRICDAGRRTKRSPSPSSRSADPITERTTRKSSRRQQRAATYVSSGPCGSRMP